MTQKQINIRDDEIYARLRRAAARRGVPMKEAVRIALKLLEERDGSPSKSDPDLARRLGELDLLTERMAARAVLRTTAEDDAELYGEDGLPR